MTDESPGLAACPACVAGAISSELAEKARASAGQGDQVINLSLPTIYCAACISAVERGLEGFPGVKSARVNLTLKRVRIEAASGLEPATLVAAIEGLGYEAHELDNQSLSTTDADKAERDLLMRLAVAGFAMMNVMLLSIAVWSGATDATRDLFHWISALIAIPTIAFSAQPFFRSAWSMLRHARLNMDVPISLAIILAAGMSIYETSQSGQHAYFDAAISLTFFLLAGRYLDHRSRATARSAAQELAALEVPRAILLTAEGEETVDVRTLAPGDRILVRPGGRFPVDGTVIEGVSDIDRALLTGESLPVTAGPGTAVSAGEVNMAAPLAVEVTATGEKTVLHQMAELVALAERAKTRYVSLADRAAAIYAPAVHLLALFAFVGWMIASGDVRMSLNIAVAVLIITCPCALGLAVPAVTTAATGRLFRRGILVKNATALERLAEVDTVVFDKTGTLTQGVPMLRDASHVNDNDMAVAMALAQGSSHPLSRALFAVAEGRGLHPASLGALNEKPGHGVEARLNGLPVRLGRAEWVGEQPLPVTTTWLKIGEAPAIAFEFTDALRDGAKAATEALRRAGIEMRILSGDSAPVVADIAADLGIKRWEAGVMPADKADIVAGLEAQGHRVLMVGDGLNDTAALASAHVSISPAAALDAARVASDMVLLRNDLGTIPGAITTARMATKRIRENFAMAALYNAIAVPIALAGFATPLAAALAMSASSISVSLNAIRLK
ncbi:MAG: heavy metal translocating P-type ATPase [Brevirhabdus sp.]